MRNKKGFTLVELTITLAVTAIVVSMVCGFIIVYQNQSLRVGQNKEAVSDITLFRRTLNEWITEYDNISNTISANGGRLICGADSIEFASDQLIWKKNGSEYRTYSFNVMSNCVFEIKNGMVYCKTVCNDKSVDLMFNVFSMTGRDRYSTGSRASQN